MKNPMKGLLLQQINKVQNVMLFSKFLSSPVVTEQCHTILPCILGMLGPLLLIGIHTFTLVCNMVARSRLRSFWRHSLERTGTSVGVKCHRVQIPKLSAGKVISEAWRGVLILGDP